jgi:tetratricopeptide (TPR) repeat protein
MAGALPDIMRCMVFAWLKARDAVDAGAELADSFPAQTTADYIRAYIDRCTDELRARKLSFYKRVRFANAFKWRLLEKGVAAETAHDITQTLLINIGSLGPAAAAAPVAVAPTGAAASGSLKPVDARSLDALLQRADESVARGAYLDAVAQYQDYTARRPKDFAGFNNLGATLTKLGRLEAARSQLHTALALSPKNADAMFNMGNLRMALGRHADAENYFRRAAAMQQTDPLIRSQLGESLAHQSLLDKSRTEFDKVLKANPRFAPALAGLATVERLAGRFVEAEQLYRRALEVDPRLPAALVGLSVSRRMRPDDAQWLADTEQLAANTESPLDEASLRFALGKGYDDLGRYAQAFSNYERGNLLLKPLAKPYDAREYSRFVNDMSCVYTPEVIKEATAGGSSSTTPVFVVGMPRSGTSLVEQILASHPAVAGIGELEFWTDELRSDATRIRRELLPAQVRQKMAANYLHVLKSRHPEAGHVVDKTPVNADYLGLIHSVFPDARILYVRRDPIDTCLSCYFQNFALSLNFTFDLNDLASYYRQHARLMAHWRKVLPPGTLIDVPYEELVADQEGWTRRILAHVGLEWDVACLKFNENPRPVVTASSWQVRQRIYGDSVKRWRHYSKFIQPLLELDRA